MPDALLASIGEKSSLPKALTMLQVPRAHSDGRACDTVLHVLHPCGHHDLRGLWLPHDLPKVRCSHCQLACMCH